LYADQSSRSWKVPERLHIKKNILLFIKMCDFGNPLYIGMLHACATHNIESVKTNIKWY